MTDTLRADPLQRVIVSRAAELPRVGVRRLRSRAVRASARAGCARAVLDCASRAVLASRMRVGAAEFAPLHAAECCTSLRRSIDRDARTRMRRGWTLHLAGAEADVGHARVSRVGCAAAPRRIRLSRIGRFRRIRAQVGAVRPTDLVLEAWRPAALGGSGLGMRVGSSWSRSLLAAVSGVTGFQRRLRRTLFVGVSTR